MPKAGFRDWFEQALVPVPPSESPEELRKIQISGSNLPCFQVQLSLKSMHCQQVMLRLLIWTTYVENHSLKGNISPAVHFSMQFLTYV